MRFLLESILKKRIIKTMIKKVFLNSIDKKILHEKT